jgi:hypothetical protein
MFYSIGFQGYCYITFFSFLLTNVAGKLECLSLASLSMKAKCNVCDKVLSGAPCAPLLGWPSYSQTLGEAGKACQ